MSFAPPPTLVIAVRELGKYSETFIKAHVERLPLEVRVVCGDPPVPPCRPEPYASGGAPSMAQHLALVRAGAVLAEMGDIGVHMMAPARAADVPLIVHFHGFDCYKHEMLAAFGEQYRAMFDQAAAIIAVSAPMVAQLGVLGAPRHKVFRVPCGVDPASFAGARPETAPPTFLAVSRFVEKKGPLLTLRAFEEVHRAIADARLVMIGDGPLLGPGRQLAQVAGLEGAVEFLAPQPHHEIAAWMRRCRGFVQHSLRALDGDAEGTPVGVIEAQMSGLPVVATRHAGIPEVVAEGETGFLVDELDVAGMSSRMIELARSPALAARLGTAARQRALEHYRMDDRLQHLAQVIDRASGGHFGTRAPPVSARPEAADRE